MRPYGSSLGSSSLTSKLRSSPPSGDERIRRAVEWASGIPLAAGMTRILPRGRGHGGLRIFHMRDIALDRFLHLLEGPHFDLSHALARYAELIGELLQRDRLVSQPAGFEYAALAVVEDGERFTQRLVPVL